MLKNPWAQKRWTGKYSPGDNVNWNAGLSTYLNYDRQEAQKTDNGVFWIDYKSLCKHGQYVIIAWRKEKYSHRACFHG